MDYITKRIPIKECDQSEFMAGIIDKYDLDDDTVFIYKGLIPTDVQFKEKERASIDYITTKSPDRDREIVLPQGAILEDYQKNPIVLWCHDYKELPVGKNMWIKADENGLVAKTQYAKHKRAQELYDYRKDGFPMAKSIGLIPLETVEEKDFNSINLKELGLEKKDLDRVDRIFTKWLLLEYSDVPVPSNPDALQLAISKGILTQDQAKEYGFPNVVNKPETTEQYHRIPIPKEEGKHSGHVIKTITIKEGIKALYCADCKKVITYLFDKKIFTMNQAKQWFQEHTKKDSEIGIIKMLDTTKKEEDPTDCIVKRWNPTLSKAFDISEVQAQPHGFEYEIFSKFLECEVKEIFQTNVCITGPMMGTWLAGYKEILTKYILLDTRNFTSVGTEKPLMYESIQLNSKISDEFLINGTCFYNIEEKPVIIKFSPIWSGILVHTFIKSEYKKVNKDFYESVQKWVSDNDFLKGEAFAINGSFLERGTNDWGNVILPEKIETSIKRSLKSLSEKSTSRGLMFLGPPGTGKTLTGKVILDSTKNTFIWVSSKDFLSSGSIYGLSIAFSLARKLAPTTLFIEDIDNWIRDYTVDLLKTEMDGLKENKGVLTIVTSNEPERFPDALIDRPGRFHDIFNFALPDSNTRLIMLKRWLNIEKSEDIIDIVKETGGYSGAHLRELIDYAEIIAEEQSISMDEALVISLEKLKEQKELIDSIRGGSKKNIQIELDGKELSKVIHDMSVKQKAIDKVGRVISSKNRTTIRNAIEGMSKATGALNSLLEAVEDDKKVLDEENLVELIHKIGQNNVVSPQEDILELESLGEDMTIEIDEEVLSKTINMAVNTVMKDAFTSVGQLVEESVKKRKGEIF